MKMASFFYTMLASVGILVAVILYGSRKSTSCLEVRTNRVLIDGNMQMQNPLRVQIKDGLFSKIESDSGSRTSECTELDLRGLFVLPGLVDAHSHLFAYDRQAVTGWAEAMQISAERDNEKRIEQAKLNAISMLKYGFIAVRDLGNSGNFLDAKFYERIKEWGHRFPNLYFSGPGIAVWPSQVRLNRAPHEYRLISETRQIPDILNEYSANKVEWIKLYLDNSPSPQSMSTGLFLALIEQAHQKGFRVTVHAERKDSVLRALSSKVDSIEHFYEIPQKESRKVTPFVVLTEIASDACSRFSIRQPEARNCEFEKMQKTARGHWLKKSKARLVFGSDAMLDFMHSYRSRGEGAIESLISWSEIGMTAMDAILAATKNAGELLNKPLGQIREGFQAHLVAYSEDPTLNLRHLRKREMIIKDGKVFCSSAEDCHGP